MKLSDINNSMIDRFHMCGMMMVEIKEIRRIDLIMLSRY